MVAVQQIMKTNLVTVGPETSTREAVETMRRHRVGCLPVVGDDVLVGIITERDLINVTSMLLDQHVRESSDE